jgi:hypothetical protein
MDQWRKPFLVFLTAAILYVLIVVVGHRVTYSLLIGRYEIYKDAYVVISIIETVLLVPLASIAIGVFVAILEPERGWWLAGVSLLPLFGYQLYQMFAPPVFTLWFINETLTMISAFLVSRWRRKTRRRQRES